MNPKLFTIWGPFAIHAYGLCIAVGVVCAFVLMLKDKKLQKIVTLDELIMSVQLVVVSGYLGGRLGFLLSEAQHFSDYWLLLQFWQPGLSILGGIIAALMALFWYVRVKKIPALPYLDRLTVYAPLVQSFGRLGCFFAGCCYGLQTDRWWAIVYCHPDHMAPLHLSLHPTQLYSAVILFLIFLLQYFVIQKFSKTAGVLFFSYLFLVSLERFLVDFVRADRLFFDNQYFVWFSIHQWVAMAMVLCAGVGFVMLKNQK